MDPEPYDVLAVELSSFQLHYTHSMSAESAAVLNFAEDHLDWYDDEPGVDATLTGMERYAADKARIFERVQRACVYNLADAATEEMVREADVAEGARAVGFTLGMPGVGNARHRRGPARGPGLHRGARLQRRRALHPRRPRLDGSRTSSPTPWPPRRSPAPTASASRPYATGCAPSAPTATASPSSRRVDGVTWVDDSKATNPHAAQSSLGAYDPVVWVAGGLAKGARFDDLVVAVRERLRGVVLLGRDRQVIADALSRHAPDVPVIDVGADETGDPMERVGRRGRRARQVRGHGAAGAGLRLHGHVPQLRRPR